MSIAWGPEGRTGRVVTPYPTIAATMPGARILDRRLAATNTQASVDQDAVGRQCLREKGCSTPAEDWSVWDSVRSRRFGASR